MYIPVQVPVQFATLLTAKDCLGSLQGLHSCSNFFTSQLCQSESFFDNPVYLFKRYHDEVSEIKIYIYVTAW